MARCPLPIKIPAFWNINCRKPKFQRRVALTAIVSIPCCLCFIFISESLSFIKNENPFHSDEIKKYEYLEVTDTSNKNLYYGVVVDAGSSGTRVFVYFWPQHTGKSNELLNIHQMKDKERNPVVKKIKPGLSSLAESPDKVCHYMKPLLDYAANHVPLSKHPETPLYILATAGMRMLPDSQREAILKRLREDIPAQYNFLFSEKHVEVISGKQEGVYAWIGINYVLGRFKHEEPDHVVAVDMNDKTLVRKRTVGVLDMGGGSAQIAFEVPQKIDFNEKEYSAKGHLAEFNLGCHQHESDHIYRVYVTTFLGFGSNAARGRYEKNLVNSSKTLSENAGTEIGSTSSYPILDPCLPVQMVDQVQSKDRSIFMKGIGNFSACRESVKPLLNLSVPCQKEPCSFNGVFQPEIEFGNSEFFGFSEYWYCMEDVLRMGGNYEYEKFIRAAKNFCSTRWSLLQEHHNKGLYTKADKDRLKYQCFKSAWITTVLHDGFKFPKDYKYLRTASLIHDKEVQWTLGAILHRTRFLPLREIQQGALQKPYRPPWIRAATPWLSAEYILIICFIVVGIFILVYIRRLRRMNRFERSLPRVSTMAYFMTDEDQIQEGIYETRGVLPK